MDVLKQVLNEIKPSEEEAKKVMSKVDAFIKKIKIKDAEVFLGGSGAKGTWLKNTFDIDVFVRFDFEKYKDKDISQILEKTLKPFKPEKLHGSRDYFQVNKEDFTYEIVIGNDCWDRCHQPDGRGDERLRDTWRHSGEVGRALSSDVSERVHDSPDCTEETDERSGATDGRQERH